MDSTMNVAHAGEKRMRSILLACLTFLLGLSLFLLPARAEAATKNGLLKEDGYYYYYESGKRVSGWKTIGEKTYYFHSKNYRAVTGLQKIGSYTYYFNDYGQMRTGYWKITVDGAAKYYYFSPSTGRSSAGIHEIPDKGYSYYFDGKGGIAKDSLMKVGSYYYYFNSSGVMITSSLRKVGSHYYYFGSNGRAATGWKTVSGSKYYFDSSGRALTGLQKIGSYTYLFSDAGKMLTGFRTVTVDGVKKYYYFASSSGKSTKGVFQIEGSNGTYSRYFNGDGTYAKDKLVKVGSDYYYFNANGVMSVNSARKVGDYYYYFGDDGKAATGGWTTIDNGDTYYFQKNGRALTGKQQVGNYCYFFGNNGVMQTRVIKEVDGSYYYFNSKGRMGKSCWQKVGDHTYYLGDDGKALMGRQTIDGKLYYFNETNARMLVNSFKTLSGKRYYFGSDGVAARGWLTIEEGDYAGKYYFNKNNYAASGLVTIGGETYYFGTGDWKMKTGYRSFGEGDEKTYYYFDLDSGKSLAGIHPGSDGSFNFYYDGAGHIEKGFVTEGDKIFYMLPNGRVCYDNWRNVGDPSNDDYTGDGTPLYIHCDSETGEVIQGKTSFEREYDGEYCTYFMDIEAENGYRLGLIEVSEGESYYFTTIGAKGTVVKGFRTEITSSDPPAGNVRYFDLETGEMQTSGTVGITGTELSIPVNEDGTLDIEAGTVINDGDSARTRLVKAALSQLYKPYGHPFTSNLLSSPLQSINNYNCSGFIIRMYFEVTGGVEEQEGQIVPVGTDIFNSDNDLILLGSMTFSDMAGALPGDIVFYNNEACEVFPGANTDGREEGDVVCRRIHEDITVGDTRAHVHHVGIYVGDGQMIHASDDGIVIVPIELVYTNDTFFLLGYGNTNTLDALD